MLCYKIEGAGTVSGGAVVAVSELLWLPSFVVRSTTSRIIATITALATTTGIMYLEYHLKQVTQLPLTNIQVLPVHLY